MPPHQPLCDGTKLLESLELDLAGESTSGRVASACIGGFVHYARRGEPQVFSSYDGLRGSKWSSSFRALCRIRQLECLLVDLMINEQLCTKEC